MSAEEMAGTVEDLKPDADEQPPLAPGAGEPEPGPMQAAGHTETKFVYRLAEKSLRKDTTLGPNNPRQELSAAGLSRKTSGLGASRAAERRAASLCACAMDAAGYARWLYNGRLIYITSC
jgi:hypothetical protein